MEYWFEVLIIALSPYALMLGSWMWGLKQLHAKKIASKSSNAYGITIVVPFRNESRNLKRLFKELGNQNYPEHLFEIIAVNDHSDDINQTEIRGLESEFENLRILSLKEQDGKKAAIQYGIKKASHEIIITTDADCSFNTNWLYSMSKSFAPDKDHLLAAPVRLAGKGFVANLMQAEQAALMATTAATISMKQAIICNGANLMFPKSIYKLFNEETLRFDIPSGDDVFLLQAIQTHFGKEAKIFFNPSKDATVITQPAKGLVDFIYQRVRWAKKSKHYKSLQAQLTALTTLIANAIIILSFYLLFEARISLLQFCLILGLKWALDYTLVNRVKSWFPINKSIFSSFILSVFYPFYVLLIASLTLILKPKWKQRRI